MTTPDPRLEEIEGRLAAVTQGPWDAVVSANRKWPLVLAHPGTADETELARMADDDDAWFTANAPADIAYLLAELRKAQDKVARVEGLHTSSGGHNPSCHCGIPAGDGALCIECGGIWPCPTSAAVADATGGGDS